VPTDQQLPTLWDPVQLFLHLALWAGVPAVAVLAAVVGTVSAIRAWIGLGKDIIHVGVQTQSTIRTLTADSQRARFWWATYSILAIAFSYMLAVIVDAGVRLFEADPRGVGTEFSSLSAMGQQLAVRPLAPAAVWTVLTELMGIGLLGVACIANLRGTRKLIRFLGGVLTAAAFLILIWMGVSSAAMWFAVVTDLATGKHSSDPSVSPPLPLAFTATMTAGLAWVVALLLPRISKASDEGFAPGRFWQ
jgi:hypothetical protein